MICSVIIIHFDYKLKITDDFFLRLMKQQILTNKNIYEPLCFIDGDSITEEYLFSKELPEGTIGPIIFRAFNEFFAVYDIRCVNWFVHSTFA